MTSVFVHLEKFLLTLIIGKIVLLDIGFLAGRFFFEHSKCYSTAFWPLLLLLRSQLLIFLGVGGRGFLVSDESFSSCCFQDFLPISGFQHFNYMCVLWISKVSLCKFTEMYRLVFFKKFGKFLPIILWIFFLFCPSSSPIMHMLLCLMVSHVSLKLFIFIFPLIFQLE